MAWKSLNDPVATTVKVTCVCKEGTSSTPGNSAMAGAPSRAIEVSGGAGPLSLMIPLDSSPSAMAGGSNSKASIWGGDSGDLASVTFIGSSFVRLIRREFPYPGKAQIMLLSYSGRDKKPSENPERRSSAYPIAPSRSRYPRGRDVVTSSSICTLQTNVCSTVNIQAGLHIMQGPSGRGYAQRW